MKVINGDILTIDLNDETKKQVIVDKEINRYLGHVSTIKYSYDSSIYAAYVRGHGRGQGILKKSDDFGRTWSERLSLPKSWLTLLQVPTLYEIQFPHETNKLFMITGHLPIRYSILDEKKEVWSELKPIGDFGGNVSFSSFIKLPSGKYLGFFHDDGRFINRERQDCRFRLYKSEGIDDINIELTKSAKDDCGQWTNEAFNFSTKDHSNTEWSKKEMIYESYFGKKRKDDVSKVYQVTYEPTSNTWGSPKVIIKKDDAFLAEAGACVSPDGKQLLLLMRDNTRKHNSFISISDDNGETWSNPKEGPCTITGDRHILKYANDGRLLCVFRDSNTKSLTYGDWMLWVGRYDDLLSGKGGQYRVRLKKNYKDIDCGYSGLEVNKDGEILAISYGHWHKNEPPYILSVAFRLDEIDAFHEKLVE